MKTILDKNKEAIKLIVSKCGFDEWKDYQFYSVFHSIYKRSIILKPKAACGFELQSDESDNKEQITEYKKAIFEGYIPLVELVNLFRYLEKNNLISFIPYYGIEWLDFEDENFKIIHSGISVSKLNYIKINDEELKKKRFTIKDDSVIKYLNDKYSCLISISPELIDLVQNDFKTLEERRFDEEMSLTKNNHKKAMRKANYQIFLGWVAFLVALISPFITTYFDRNNITDVKSVQIEQRLDKIINQMVIPDTIKTEIINDTLKVIVTKPLKNKDYK